YSVGARERIGEDCRARRRRRRLYDQAVRPGRAAGADPRGAAARLPVGRWISIYGGRTKRGSVTPGRADRERTGSAHADGVRSAAGPGAECGEGADPSATGPAGLGRYVLRG